MNEYEYSPEFDAEVGLRDAEVPCKFVTGQAGTGKTHKMREEIAADPQYGVLASTTGISAVNLGTITLNSLIGYFDTESLRDKFLTGRLTTVLHQLALQYRNLVIDECFDYKQPILTEQGWQRIGDIVKKHESIRVYSFNSQTKELELKPVISWARKRYEGELLRINVGRSDSRRDARVIRCTPDHKILTPTGYVHAKELRVGDPVIVRGPSLTPLQRSLVIGSLLGDAGMNRNSNRNSPQVVFTHGEDQLSYLEYKRQILGELAGKLRKGKSGYNPNRTVYQLPMKIADELYEIAEEMKTVRPRVWEPTDKFISWITPEALAFWFADDGSVNSRRNRAEIHTPLFSAERHEALCAHLSLKFRLDCKPAPNGKGNLKIAFTAYATRKLIELIRPIVPSCMDYKVWGAHGHHESEKQPQTCTAPVRGIEFSPLHAGSTHVFDIEVEDNHNYVAGNVIVSNCSMMDAKQIDYIYEAMRQANGFKDVKEPMGIILVGDMAQLPAIKCKQPYEADCWEHFDANTERLTRMWRQDEPMFLMALNAARRGDGNEAARLLTEAGVRWETSLEMEFDGTTIVSKNDAVDRYNWEALSRVRGQKITVRAQRWGKQRGDWRLVPDMCDFKIGAYVMLLANKMEEGEILYANGDCGHIVNYERGLFDVELVRKDADGDPIVVSVGQITRNNDSKDRPDGWYGPDEDDEDDDKGRDAGYLLTDYFPKPHIRGAKRDKRYVMGQVRYYPMRLAYASTVHKVQGLSLDRIQVDVRNPFFSAPSMEYVALSRARTLGGLRIVGMREKFAKNCKTDPKVARWL